VYGVTEGRNVLRPAILKNFQLVFLFLISLVLMIQGWGDRVDFLSHPARAGVVVVTAFSVLLLLFVPFDLFAAGEQEIRRQRWGTYLALGVVGVLCWFLPYADRRDLLVWPESHTLRYGGLACVAIGVGLRVAGMMQLKELFSGFVAIQKEHYLLTTGCYRWVRHPIYTGSLLALVGFLLVFRSQLIVLILPLYLIGTVFRIADEERLLGEVFGQKYERYRARTWRLIPFLW
jgi:protein-S-isoprenylcysteine O-methyltransferase Ste14